MTPEQQADFEQGILNVCNSGAEYGWPLVRVLRAVKYHTAYWDKERMPAKLRQHIADIYSEVQYAAVRKVKNEVVANEYAGVAVGQDGSIAPTLLKAGNADKLTMSVNN